MYEESSRYFLCSETFPTFSKIRSKKTNKNSDSPPHPGLPVAPQREVPLFASPRSYRRTPHSSPHALHPARVPRCPHDARVPHAPAAWGLWLLPAPSPTSLSLRPEAADACYHLAGAGQAPWRHGGAPRGTTVTITPQKRALRSGEEAGPGPWRPRQPWFSDRETHFNFTSQKAPAEGAAERERRGEDRAWGRG